MSFYFTKTASFGFLVNKIPICGSKGVVSVKQYITHIEGI